MHQRLRARHAHAFSRIEHLRGYGAQPREDVAEQDQQRVGDERDLSGVEVRTNWRDEQLEQRERRDRVEERGHEDRGLLEPAEAMRDQRERHREHEADRDGDQDEVDVLAQGRPQQGSGGPTRAA